MESLFNRVNLPIFLPNPAESCKAGFSNPLFWVLQRIKALLSLTLQSLQHHRHIHQQRQRQQQHTTTDTIECNTMSNVLTFKSRRIAPKLRALNHAESRRITPNRAESCRIAPNRAESRRIPPNPVESRRITPNRAAPNHAESRRITPNRAEAAPKRARSRRIPPVSPLHSLQPHCNTVSDVLGNFGHTEFHGKKG